MSLLAGVIFDMDGVIVDSEPHHERAFLEVVDEIGYNGRHGLRFEDYLGRTDHDLWADFLRKHQPAQTFEELLAMKRQRVIELIRSEQPLFAGLPELIKRLSISYRLGLASGSERLVVDEVLALQGIHRFFSATVSATDVKRGKPAPDIFLRAAELIGVRPQDCWVIEDSKPGISAGLAAGMRVIAITNSHPARELGQAHYVVSRYEEIDRLLLPQDG